MPMTKVSRYSSSMSENQVTLFLNRPAHSIAICLLYVAATIFRPNLYAQATQPAAEPTTQPALRLTVSPAGEIRIARGEKVLASGRWTLTDCVWHAAEPDQVPIGPVQSTKGSQENSSHATIVDTYAAVIATTDVSLEGEDLCLAVHIENRNLKGWLRNIELHGLIFHFARNPTGTLPSWHISYIGAEGSKVFHPGLRQPVGLVYAHDDENAVAAFSATEFDRLSLFNASFQKDGIIPAESFIEFYTLGTAAPGSSVDIDARFRITSNFALPHLLDAYKQVYLQHFPSLLYHPDSRPVAQFAAVGKNLITRDNPLGFGGPFRRLDSAAGSGAYVRIIAPTLENAGGIGFDFLGSGRILTADVSAGF